MSDDVAVANKPPRKYRLQIIVHRDILCNTEDLDETVMSELGKLGSLGYNCVAHHAIRVKDKNKKRILGEFAIDDVIPFISPWEERREYIANGKTYLVKMNSERYFVFRDNMACVSCGLQGVRMMLEQHPGDKTAHFNMYGEEDGVCVLMTKDHIHAKSVGGKDELANFVTMCSICNNIKANHPITLEQLRTLRHFYNENKKLVPKRILSKQIADQVAVLVAENQQNSINHIPSFQPTNSLTIV